MKKRKRREKNIVVIDDFNFNQFKPIQHEVELHGIF